MEHLYKDIESIHIWHNNKSDYSDMDICVAAWSNKYWRNANKSYHLMEAIYDSVYEYNKQILEQYDLCDPLERISAYNWLIKKFQVKFNDGFTESHIVDQH